MVDAPGTFKPGNFNWAALAGLASGSNPGEQLGNANDVMAQQQEKAQGIQAENQTKAWLAKQFPGEDFSQLSGPALNAAYSSGLQRYAQAKQPKSADFKVLPDGTYGTWDGSKFNPLGTAQKPAELPSSVQEFEYAKKNGYNGDIVTYQRDKAARANDDYASRQAAANQIGLTETDPGYKTFILTGKMPREDQQTLTAVDKKAILEADDMVAVNEGAINALKQAKELSPKANAGWFSGTRATLGNNLPDWMVPDNYVSSPESSVATQDFDNAIVGQALTQLKAIFGGAPTEGERKILLDLQGSSNLQPAVREKIIDRAIQMAERRLEFNRERASDMRGGDYYKPGRTDSVPLGDAIKIGPNGEGYDQVPPGAKYVAPDGSTRVKGGQ